MRVLAVSIVVAALLVGAVPAARADSWAPYGKRRVPDPTGRWYVVLEGEQKGSGARFTFAEAKAGTSPVTAIKGRPFGDAKDAGVREGDTVVSTGTLRSAPLEVRVSSLGLGFAAMEEFMAVGYGDSFAWVTREGAVRHAKRLSDLFSPEEIQSFTHSVSSIWWFESAWIDETTNEVVIVGVGGLLRAVGIDGGKVRKAGDAEVRRAVTFLDPQASGPALDLAVSRKIPGLEDALRTVFADEKRALGTRLRAASALADAGDRRGVGLLTKTAATRVETEEAKRDRRTALEVLPRALGEAAIPVLRDAMRAPTESVAWGAATEGLASLGEKAVPALVAMLAEKGQSTDYRGGAAHALGRVGSKAALPALLAAIADPEEYVANAAANAAIAIGKGSISKELAAMLDRATTQDDRIAMYFKEVEEPASVAPLIRAFERHPVSRYPGDLYPDALAFQTGKSFGADLAAWKAWLAKSR